MNDNEHPLTQLLAGTPAGQSTVVLRTLTPSAHTQSQERLGRDPASQAAAQAYLDSGERLHGDRAPSATILVERPIHRLMVYLHAMGKSVREIAAQTERSESSVSQILRQPWARERLVTILKEAGIDEVSHFLKSEVSPSLVTLREVRDASSSKPSERTAAANAILDRALGKPTVHVETDNTNRNVPADLQRIEAEISAVRKQLGERAHGDGSN